VEINYHQLYTKAQQLAAAFVHLGLKSQDRIGIYSPNNYEWVLTQFAAAMADLVLVNINPAYQVSELQYALNKVLSHFYILRLDAGHWFAFQNSGPQITSKCSRPSLLKSLNPMLEKSNPLPCQTSKV
jgi:acyl-CoA synthetase (AMP-forming)/AMP-acid ligase II